MCEWCGIVDTAAIAERLGVKPSTVHQWRQRNIRFPEPLTVLKIGPVWKWADIEEWATNTRRSTTSHYKERLLTLHHHHDGDHIVITTECATADCTPCTCQTLAAPSAD